MPLLSPPTTSTAVVPEDSSNFQYPTSPSWPRAVEGPTLALTRNTTQIKRNSIDYKVIKEDRLYNIKTGTIITIQAYPKYALEKFETEKITSSTTILNLGTLALGGFFIYGASKSNDKDAKLFGYVIAAGLILNFIKYLPKLGNVKIKSEIINQETEKHKTRTAANQNVYFVFTPEDGIQRKIFIGQFNDDNKLTFRVMDYLNTSIYLFKDEDEFLNYLSQNYSIQFDWKN